MNLKKLFFAAVIVLSANATFAQADTNVASHLVTINIPQVALLDLEATTTAITLAGTAPIEAGLPMTFEDATAKNATIWMNYSSIAKGGVLKNVGVAITAGTVPTGLKLTVLAGTASATGAGKKGTASAALTLTAASQNILTGIGSAYTGNGTANGHLLTYQLGLSDTAADYANLDFNSSNTVTITYTLSDGI